MRKLCFFLSCCLILVSSTTIAAADKTVAVEENIDVIENTQELEFKFNDIDGHWSEDIIIKWQEAGYIDGYPDGSFKPDNPVTRAELAKILTKVFDLQESQALSYEDISDDDWYYSYLERSARYIPNYQLPTLYESNMPYHEIMLQNKNYILPETYAIRMHVAEALVEIKLDREDIEIEELTIQEIFDQLEDIYKDLEIIATPRGIPPNVERMNRYTWLAYKLGIMYGNDGYFYPYGYITRAELLTAIDRMIE